MKHLFLNDRNILILILINAIIIFLNGFDMSHEWHTILTWIDNTITILFITEQIIKFRTYGRDYLSSGWNKLDVVLVALAVPSLMAFILNMDIRDFNYLLIFRVLRVLKSFRFLKFIPGIDHLINGLKRALKASVIVIIAFVMYIFIVGIFSLYLFRESAPEYFRDPFMALYSTFKIFTIEGWFDIPEKVTESLSPIPSFLTYMYFILVVLSGGIFGLSLVNSIFVDAMVSDNNDELERKIVSLEEKIDQLIKIQEGKGG